MYWQEFRQTLRLSIPLIISNVAQVGLALIDSAMVGAIDYKQLAASSLVINAIGIPQVICMGLCIAITPLVSIARGRGDQLAASRYLYNGTVVATLGSILIALLCTLAMPLLDHLGQDPAIVAICKPYYLVMVWGLVPMTLFLSMKQFSDALEHTRTGMLLALLSLPLNAFLNWLLIFGHMGLPRLELFGAGIATALSRIIIVMLMAGILWRHRVYQSYIRLRRQAWHLRRPEIKELLHIGVPSGLQLVMEAGAFSISGIMVGWLGAEAQAAHQIALNCASTTFMAVLGLAMGASIRASHALGAGRPDQLKVIGKTTIMGGLLYGLATALLFVLLRQLLPLMFTTEPAVVESAATLLLVAALFQASDSLQCIGAGLCRGIKDVKIPTALVALAYWVIGIPVGYYLAFPLQWGAAGIWWGLVIGLSAAAILLNQRFLRLMKTAAMAI
ncbi:MAG: MATE family efflux transporter [Chitinophagaceae bacterium]|jgi:MATE family multidrug resistance protein|nr:MATE family efflux transporter [Chitinophagaceae bacterium]